MSTALQPAPATTTAVAKAAPENVQFSGDIINNPAMFAHVQRIATVLAHGQFTPKHLTNGSGDAKIATCFRVAAQAIRWDFDPFAVADETYEVHGRLGYQGKLIIAVVNARAGLKGPLSFTFDGKGDGRTVKVSGTLKTESEPRTVELSVGQAKTKNEMWLKDPDQKLCYSGAIKWARRHCPEVVMGVRTVEDLESMAPPQAAAGAPVRTLDDLANRLMGPSEEPKAETPACDDDGEVIETTAEPIAEETTGQQSDYATRIADLRQKCQAATPEQAELLRGEIIRDGSGIDEPDQEELLGLLPKPKRTQKTIN